MGAVTVVEDARTVFLVGEIDDETSAAVCIALLTMEAQNPDERIKLMINSPGGSTAGWQIADTVKMLGVETICLGQTCSMAALILIAGKPGCRSILPHGRVMFHQPLAMSPFQQASDFIIQAQELQRRKDEMVEFISKCTGKTIDQVAADCDRNHWFNAEEAVGYGIVDYIETGILHNVNQDRTTGGKT